MQKIEIFRSFPRCSRATIASFVADMQQMLEQ